MKRLITILLFTAVICQAKTIKAKCFWTQAGKVDTITTVFPVKVVTRTDYLAIYDAGKLFNSYKVNNMTVDRNIYVYDLVDKDNIKWKAYQSIYEKNMGLTKDGRIWIRLIIK